MNKEVNIEEAMTHIKSGMTIMSNGFMGVKSPETIIDAMVDQGIDAISLITNRYCRSWRCQRKTDR